MKPITRLSNLAGGSLDAIGAALADIPRVLNHQSHRIAITGLQRAGKTVFVTSFTHALLHAAKAPIDAFPFFPWRGQVQDVSVGDIPGIPRFPYGERLDDLLADTPKWPEPTIGLTGLRIRMHHTPTGPLTRRILPKATLDLDLIDYPGEWLLDLPMLTLTYDEWSRQMEELANAGSRAALSADWLGRARTLDPDAKEDAFELARIGGAYLDYLKRCRSENLHYLQPGRFITTNFSAQLDTIFFPLSRAKSVRAGTNAAALVRRFEAYQKLVRRFYGDVFGRLRRQVVLVDLLTALQHGPESFADLALAMRTISDAFEDLKNPLLKLLPIGRADRLALVATKADHVTADQINNLKGLLRDMIGAPFMQAKAPKVDFLAVASVQATTQSTREFEGQHYPFLRGIPDGQDTGAVEVQPGVIPGSIPSKAEWAALEFRIRQFAPPRLGSPYEQPLPHINLDKVLQFLIA